MPDAGQNYRLDDLKQRWERDPSSRLFLQLADEHRKLGQPLEAVAVLEKGLEHRPNDLSALVALGRCRLELDQVNEAVAALETVISRDPTHIVANKLLLDAYLQQGDAERAQARLETYRLLNGRDPELGHLEYRLERLRADQPTEASTVVLAEFVAEEALTDDSGDDGSGDFELVAEETAPGDGEPAVVSTVFESMDSESTDSESTVSESTGETFFTPPVASSEAVTGVEGPKETWEYPFLLAGQDLPEPDLAALWRHRTSSSQRLADPFEGLPKVDADQHWATLTREGIFAPSASVTTASPEPTASDEDQALPVSEPVASVMVDPQVTDLRPTTDSAEAISSDSSEPDFADESADESRAVAGWMAGVTALAGAAAAATIGLPDASEDSAQFGGASDDLDTDLFAAAVPEETPIADAAVAEVVTESAPFEDVAADMAPPEDVSPEVASPEDVSPEVASPEDLSPEVASPEDVAAHALADPEAVSLDSAVHSEPEEATSGEAVDARAEPASATLGSIYLQQGHREEAERIFRQVLEDEPGNAAALAGLAEVEGRDVEAPVAKSLTAADLLAVRSTSGKIPEGLTAKKILILDNYIKHLRVGHHVH